jgi:DNA-binding GntR family transcriptional regulator
MESQPASMGRNERMGMTTGLGGFAPKYQRIADQLRREIREGIYSAGERMPAETTLVDRFRVSLPTVRQALNVLRAEGLIESRHGIGTFVKEDRRLQRRSRHRYGRARSDKQLLTSHLRHEITFAGRQPVPSHIAEVMGLEPGDEVVARHRVLHDKQTDRVEELGASYIPVSIAAGTFLEERQVVPKALFLCIEDLSGKQYHHARDRWIARSATPEEATLLNLPPGGQVVHVVHAAAAEDGTVLEVSESIWPADRVTIIDEYPISPEAEELPTPSEI